MQKSALAGNILPSGLRNMSLAITQVSSIRSLSKNVPSGSLIKTSTLPSGIWSAVKSSIFDSKTVITLSQPFALINFLAFSALLLASTAYTFFAPAYAANKDSMPLPAPTSITILSLKSVWFNMIASLYNQVRMLSCIMFCWFTSLLQQLKYCFTVV